MLGIEVIDPLGCRDSAGRLPASTEAAGAVQAEAFRQGLILETGGRFGSVLRLLPPLIISNAEIDRVADILASAFDRLERKAA